MGRLLDLSTILDYARANTLAYLVPMLLMKKKSL
jgi:hypothetical protein